ncbi:hypothetical protein FPK40_24415, partial [Acinetobacter baumannii]|nr:hypothetical protein [Acinetobacter baumannii]
ILLSCGPYYNVLRILVPLTIEEAQIEQGLKVIADCFSEAKQAENRTHAEAKYVSKGMKTSPEKQQ